MSTRSAFLFSIWLEFTFVYAVSVSFLYMVTVYICLHTRSAFLFSIWLEFTFVYAVSVSFSLYG